MENLWIVLPAYHEAPVLTDVITEIQDAGYRNIIVIDDGSEDSTYQIAKNTDGVIALRHRINRGKGAATKTGIEAAKILGAETIVTLDSDGQHDPKDIGRLLEPLWQNKSLHVILGSRLKGSKKGMPLTRICANFIGNLFTWYIYGLWVTDSQSGMRAYSRHAADLINTKADRYEYESAVIRQIYLHKLRYLEVPIKIRYTDYSMNKGHGQGLINGIKTLYKMVWNIIS